MSANSGRDHEFTNKRIEWILRKRTLTGGSFSWKTPPHAMAINDPFSNIVLVPASKVDFYWDVFGLSAVAGTFWHHFLPYQCLDMHYCNFKEVKLMIM